MAKLEPAAAASVIGLAGFQLFTAWSNTAPSLSDLRAATPGDDSMRQKLYDADFMVGGLALALGVAFSVLSHDMTALVVMMVIFGMVSLWHHSVLNGG
jgi:hypothetical protein